MCVLANFEYLSILLCAVLWAGACVGHEDDELSKLQRDSSHTPCQHLGPGSNYMDFRLLDSPNSTRTEFSSLK